MVNRIKQPEGCIGISEKCKLQGKVCRVAEVFSLKKNKPSHSFLSGPHVFPCCFHLLANNCTTKILCILRANKHEREMWSSAFRLGYFYILTITQF